MLNKRIDRKAVWRASDGTHYEIFGLGADGLCYLRRVEQDPDTRQWEVDRIEVIDIHEDVLLRDYTAVQREPLPEPRITRLGALIRDLLASYEDATGRSSPMAEEILAAFADVEAIPAEVQRRQRGSAAAAYARGHHTARRRR
ncbi:hypothetical protein ACX6XY_17755 [Streptomyces sp. O3]